MSGGKHQNVWISKETWRLVDERVSARRGTRVRERIRRLGQAIRASLKGDRKRRVEAVGTDVEALLGGDPPNVKEVWRRMKGWYRAAVNRALLPARDTLERITAERVELYSHVPPQGDNILVTVTLSDIDDSVPTEDEILEAVKKLRRNRSGEASGIRAEHLKGWLVAAKRRQMAEEKGEEKTEAEEEGGDLWGKVVEITQTAFWEGKLAEEAAWQTVVLIPKGRKEYRGIGLVEVTWKVVAVIIH